MSNNRDCSILSVPLLVSIPTPVVIFSRAPNLEFCSKKSAKITFKRTFCSLSTQILNVDELSALWHFPTSQTKLPNIAWGKHLFADPPENLPVATGLSDEEKAKITFFAKTEFHNQEAIFGIKEGEDRRRHTYIIGKSGTGKTTLIANMAIDDIRKGRGVAIIDPHGDLCQTILDYIPPPASMIVATLIPPTPIMFILSMSWKLKTTPNEVESPPVSFPFSKNCMATFLGDPDWNISSETPFSPWSTLPILI